MTLTPSRWRAGSRAITAQVRSRCLCPQGAATATWFRPDDRRPAPTSTPVKSQIRPRGGRLRAPSAGRHRRSLAVAQVRVRPQDLRLGQASVGTTAPHEHTGRREPPPGWRRPAHPVNDSTSRGSLRAQRRPASPRHARTRPSVPGALDHRPRAHWPPRSGSAASPRGRSPGRSPP